MYMQLSPHRMSVPPPPAGYLDSNQPSGLLFVSKVVFAALAAVLAAAFIRTVPLTVLAPIATVVVAGVAGSLALAALDRRISARATLATKRAGIREVVGVTGLVLLIIALVSPAGLRVALSSAGLLGLMGVRLAAADAGWARRASAWQRDRQRDPTG